MTVRESRRYPTPLLSAFAAGVLTVAAMSAWAEPILIDLGELAPGAGSQAMGFSVDGRTVVGMSAFQPFRWSAADGLQNLGSLSLGGGSSYAWDASGDGSVVVGHSQTHAFRWSAGSGMQDLLTLPGSPFSEAHAVSADGSVVAGWSGSQTGTGSAFRWTAADGIENIGTLGAGETNARGISADGSVIVGHSAGRPFRWTAADGIEDIDIGGEPASAYAISADGSTIVGAIGPNLHQFRWTAATGLEVLPDHPGAGSLNQAQAVSADGNVVGGRAFVSANRGYVATLWTADLGTINVATYLAGLGIDLTGWTINQIMGVYVDSQSTVLVGNAIVDTGEGFIQHGWIATGLPPLSVVLDPPTVAVAFEPAKVEAGATSTATITLTNANAADAMLTADLLDVLPSGLTATAARTTCVGKASFVADAVMLAAGAAIPAGGACTLTATVQTTDVGSYVDTIAAGDLVTDAGRNAAAATATLTVTRSTAEDIFCTGFETGETGACG